MKDTAEIRIKMLQLWKQLDAKQISASEIRLHIGLARVILETIKVEIAMAHLNRSEIPSVPIDPRALVVSRKPQ